MDVLEPLMDGYVVLKSGHALAKQTISVDTISVMGSTSKQCVMTISVFSTLGPLVLAQQMIHVHSDDAWSSKSDYSIQCLVNIIILVI